MPPEARFNFAELAVDLREPMRSCFKDLIGAIQAGTLLPLTAPADSAASAAVYVEQTSLAMLSSADADERTTLLLIAETFYDQAIGPWLIANSGFPAAELAPLTRHLRRHLLPRTLVHFNERIKDPANTESWRAFNRTLLEEVRASIAATQTGQRELAQKLDDLLSQSAAAPTLPGFASGVGAVLAAVGQSEQHLETAISTAFTRVNAEQTALQLVLRDTLDRIEQKLDSVVDTTARIEGGVAELKDDIGRLVSTKPLPWRIGERAVALCPYPGLAVFGDADASYFFGREADISRLLRQADRPVVAVTGPSGVGKSSFVLAGVLPRLRAAHPTVQSIVFRISTSTELLRDLAGTLAQSTGRPTEATLAELQTNDAALRDALLSLTADRVVFVLDQFEELFVGRDKARAAERARLLDLLLAIEAAPDPRLIVILTSRENYFEHPDYLARPALRSIVVERAVLLAGLTDAQLREAILRPLEAFNSRPERQGQAPVAFEGGVLDLFEQEFRRTERTLPLVQYLLRLLWMERRELSVAAYTQLGGLERALDRHASKIYETFSPEDQRLVRAVLLALVRPGIDNEYTRRRVAREELVGAGSERDRAARVVDRLAGQDSRIISEQQVGATTYLELTHEVLLRQWERLRVLIDTYRERLLTREQLLPVAERWHESVARGKADTTYLYRGSQLRQARDYTRTNDLPEGVDTSITSCYQASVRHQRRQIVTATVAIVATVVVLGLGFNWFTADQRAQLAAEQERSNQRATAQAQAEQTAQAEGVQRATAEANAAAEAQRAGREAEVANAQRLANLARQTFAAGDRPLALALAIEAARISDPPVQLHQALAEISYAPGLGANLGEGDLISPDGVYVLDITPEGQVRLRNTQENTTRELERMSEPPQLASTFFSPDSSLVWLIADSVDTRLSVWETATGRNVGVQVMPGLACIVFNPTDRTFATSSSTTGAFELRDFATGRVIQQVAIPAETYFDPEECGSFSRDGSFALIGNPLTFPGAAGGLDEGDAFIWDVANNSIVATFNDIYSKPIFAPDPDASGELRIAYLTKDNVLRVLAGSGSGASADEFSEVASLNGAAAPVLYAPESAIFTARSTQQDAVLVWSGRGEAQQIDGKFVPLTFNRTGTSLFVSQDGSVLRLDLGSAAQLRGTLTNANSDIASISSVHYLATAGADGSVLRNIPSIEAQSYVIDRPPPGQEVRLGFSLLNPVVSADGRVALFAPFSLYTDSGTTDPLFQIIDLEAGGVSAVIEPPGRLRSDDPSTILAQSLRPALSADGSSALISVPVAPGQSELVVWDLRQNQALRTLSSGQEGVRSVQLSPDGALAAALFAPDRPQDGFTLGSGLVEVVIWATATGAELFRQEVGQDGGVLISETGATGLTRDGGIAEPLQALFSPDGRYVAIAVAGGVLRVLDTTSWNELWQTPTRNEHLLFSSKGDLLVSSSLYGDVQVFDTTTGALLQALPQARGPAALTSDDRQLITGDNGDAVRIWQLAAGVELLRYPVYSKVMSLATAADGKSLYTGSATGLKQWRLDTLADLVLWARDHYNVPELSCEQRARYQALPLCGADGTPPPSPTAAAPSPTVATVPAPTAMPTTAAAPASTAAPTATPPADGEVVVTPPEIGADGQFRIATDGFNAGEQVLVTVRQPDGIIFDEPFEFTASTQGTVAFDLDYAGVDPSFNGGTWSVTVEGVTSRRRTMGSFNFSGYAATPTPAPTLGAADLQGLGSGNGTAVPSRGAYGTRFVLTGRGFEPDEGLAIVFRHVPSNSERVINEQRADADGNIQLRLLSTEGEGILGTQPPGLWECTITGNDSGHIVTIYLIIN